MQYVTAILAGHEGLMGTSILYHVGGRCIKTSLEQIFASDLFPGLLSSSLERGMKDNVQTAEAS